MSNIKTTDWFDGAKFVPYHVGVYETRTMGIGLNSELMYQHWNGKFFGLCRSSIQNSEISKEIKSIDQNPEWRGIKK